jgi:lipopolysaccharide/colanic/teichoic acid biosynthesis glycosyltransferase
MTGPIPRLLRLKAAIEWPIALVAVILVAPLMAVIAVTVRLSGPGPIIHRRRVLGRRGIEFDAFKFRTMVVDADRMLAENPSLRAAFAKNFKLANDPRVTAIGRPLRRFSLDELPQLLNVLRGEMALVGPRMITREELERYGASKDRLLSVRPGLTGLWQVSGRQTTSYEQRVRLDLSYISEWTPWMDLRIAVRTLGAVLTGEGAL